MDDSKTVEQYLDSVNAKVVTFARFEVGEGIEKLLTISNQKLPTMAAALTNKNCLLNKEDHLLVFFFLFVNK